MLQLHKYCHWFYWHRGKRLLFNLGFTLFVWLFLAVTQPFGIYDNNVPDWTILLFLLPISLIWLVIAYGIDYFINNWTRFVIRDSHRQDAGVWALKLIAFIHLIFLLRGHFCSWLCVDLFEYLQLWLAVFILFTLFYLPYTFYAQYRYFHRMLADGPASEADLVLTGSTKETYQLRTDQLAYLEADNNYVDLFIIEDDSIRKVPLRATLKSVEQQLQEHSEFIRIHRSYIVNTKFCIAYHRERQALQLQLSDQPLELPVSKKYRPLVRQLFTHPK